MSVVDVNVMPTDCHITVVIQGVIQAGILLSFYYLRQLFVQAVTIRSDNYSAPPSNSGG